MLESAWSQGPMEQVRQTISELLEELSMECHESHITPPALTEPLIRQARNHHSSDNAKIKIRSNGRKDLDPFSPEISKVLNIAIQQKKTLDNYLNSTERMLEILDNADISMEEKARLFQLESSPELRTNHSYKIQPKVNAAAKTTKAKLPKTNKRALQSVGSSRSLQSGLRRTSFTTISRRTSDSTRLSAGVSMRPGIPPKGLSAQIYRPKLPSTARNLPSSFSGLNFASSRFPAGEDVLETASLESRSSSSSESDRRPLTLKEGGITIGRAIEGVTVKKSKRKTAAAATSSETPIDGQADRAAEIGDFQLDVSAGPELDLTQEQNAILDAIYKGIFGAPSPVSPPSVSVPLFDGLDSWSQETGNF